MIHRRSQPVAREGQLETDGIGPHKLSRHGITRTDNGLERLLNVGCRCGVGTGIRDGSGSPAPKTKNERPQGWVPVYGVRNDAQRLLRAVTEICLEQIPFRSGGRSRLSPERLAHLGQEVSAAQFAAQFQADEGVIPVGGGYRAPLAGIQHGVAVVVEEDRPAGEPGFADILHAVAVQIVKLRPVNLTLPQVDAQIADQLHSVPLRPDEKHAEIRAPFVIDIQLDVNVPDQKGIAHRNPRNDSAQVRNGNGERIALRV